MGTVLPNRNHYRTIIYKYTCIYTHKQNVKIKNIGPIKPQLTLKINKDENLYIYVLLEIRFVLTMHVFHFFHELLPLLVALFSECLHF